MIRRPTVHRLFDVESKWYAFARRWHTGDIWSAPIDDATIRQELRDFIAELRKVESELDAVITTEGWLE